VSLGEADRQYLTNKLLELDAAIQDLQCFAETPETEAGLALLLATRERVLKFLKDADR
jgi:hypothetical protein